MAPPRYRRRMPSTRFFQVDVFTARAGGGNPLGVVTGAAHWSDQRMQAFAAWADLVETTYLLPPTSANASYRLRIFTPKREIAFAGHPSLGSAHVALASGFAKAHDGVLLQECQAGLLPIQLQADGSNPELFVRVPGARVIVSDALHLPLLDAALDGVALGRLEPAFVEGGRRWWLAELGDEAGLRAWRPDHARIKALADASDSLGLCAFARSSSGDYDLVVRAFPAGVGIVEDPASGAANGLIAAYLRAVEPDGPYAHAYTVSQGRELGRDARLKARIDGDGEVWIGGSSVTVISGELHWPM
jgi:PhzF family phenazine biosynthesis protein